MQDASRAGLRLGIAALVILCPATTLHLLPRPDLAGAAAQPDVPNERTPSASPRQPLTPSSPQPQPSPAPTQELSPGDIAIIATKDALVRFNVKDKTTQELIHEPSEWCAVDNRAQVLWYLRKEPVLPSRPDSGRPDIELLTLRFLDLKENRAPVTIVPSTRVRTSLPGLVPLIDYGDGTLGDELWHFAPTIYLRLQMQTNPKLTATLNCDGDASWYCFNMEGKPLKKLASGETEWPVTDTVAATLVDLNKMRLQQIDALVALKQRAGNRRLWRVGDEQERPRVRAVPAKDCEEDLGPCGSAVSIPGTPFWSVIVSADRGDFAHEVRQFYDPKRKRFFDPRQPGLTSPLPLKGEHALASMFISGSGRNLLMNGEVISFDSGVLVKGERGCGWLGAGWRYTHWHP